MADLIKYYVDGGGVYLGAYNDNNPNIPVGAVEVPTPPNEHADQIWNGTSWDPYTPPPPTPFGDFLVENDVDVAGVAGVIQYIIDNAAIQTVNGQTGTVTLNFVEPGDNVSDLTNDANYATVTDVTTAVANVIDGSPAALDTLNELAAALGDDPNFASTISTQLGLKVNSADLADVATSGDYNDLLNLPSIPPVAPVDSVNGQTGNIVLDTDDVGEGSTNLFFTNARVASAPAVQANTAKVSADGSIDTHSDVDISSTPPTTDQAIIWNGTVFVPADVILPGDDISELNNDAGYLAVTPPQEEVITNAPVANAGNANKLFTLQVNAAGNGYEYFEEFQDFAKDITGSVNNTTTFETYVEGVFDLPADGDYIIETSYIWSLDTAGNDFIARLLINGTVFFTHQQEAKDSGGGGVTLPTPGGGTDTTGTNQRYGFSQKQIAEGLTAGTNTFTLQWRTEEAGVEAAIYEANLIVTRLRKPV